MILSVSFSFFFTDTSTTEIYTLSLHDALPILPPAEECLLHRVLGVGHAAQQAVGDAEEASTLPLGELRRLGAAQLTAVRDRKSTRLNSSHLIISYAVFCLKKKKKKKRHKK